MGTLFGRHKAPRDPGSSPEALEALREAVERNCPAGFARLGFVGEDPLATGRLLKWEDDRLHVEELQVIGGEIRFGTGDRLECYAMLGEEVISFGVKVRDMAKPQRLNDSTIVQSIALEGPTDVAFGNRRGAYRANLGVLEKEFVGNLWFLDRYTGKDDAPASPSEDANGLFTSLRDAAKATPLYPMPSDEALAQFYGTPLPAQLDEDGNPVEGAISTLPRPAQSETSTDVALRWRTLVPSPKVDWPMVILGALERPPHARVRLADVSPNGVGMTMYGVAAMQLQRFERIALRAEVEGHKIEIVGAIRRSEELTQRRCRVGVVMVYPGPRELRAPARRSLEAINLLVQRELMKRR